MCQLGLDEGSPSVASCRVEIPDSDRATSEMSDEMKAPYERATRRRSRFRKTAAITATGLEMASS
jgi:hypothetical protein